MVLDVLWDYFTGNSSEKRKVMCKTNETKKLTYRNSALSTGLKAQDYSPLSLARGPFQRNKNICFTIAQRCSNPCKILTLHSIHFNGKWMSKFPKTAFLPLGPKKQITWKYLFITREDRKKIPIKIDEIDRRMKAIKEQTGKMGNKITEKCRKLSHSPEGV